MMCSGGNRSDEGGYYQIYYVCYFSIIIFLFFPFKVIPVHVIITFILIIGARVAQSVSARP